MCRARVHRKSVPSPFCCERKIALNNMKSKLFLNFVVVAILDWPII